MSAQNCRISGARSADGKTFVVIERKNIGRTCGQQPCNPQGIIGFPSEQCGDCKRKF